MLHKPNMRSNVLKNDLTKVIKCQLLIRGFTEYDAVNDRPRLLS